MKMSVQEKKTPKAAKNTEAWQYYFLNYPKKIFLCNNSSALSYRKPMNTLIISYQVLQVTKISIENKSYN